MSREFVPRVSKEMALDLEIDAQTARMIECDLWYHPDFRAQLRAWAAEEMRGLVPDHQDYEGRPYGEAVDIRAKNEARAETLANIERWSKNND